MARRGSGQGFTPRAGSAPGLESLADAATFRLSEAEAAAAASDYQSQFGPWTSQVRSQPASLLAWAHITFQEVKQGAHWIRLTDPHAAQEDEMLRRLVAQYGPRWKAISTELGSKSDSQVRAPHAQQPVACCHSRLAAQFFHTLV